MANPLQDAPDTWPRDLSPAELVQVGQLLAERSAAPVVADPEAPAGADQVTRGLPAGQTGVQAPPGPPAGPPDQPQGNQNHPERRRRNSRSRTRGPRRPAQELTLQRALRHVAAYCLRYGRSGIRPSFDSLDADFHSWYIARDIPMWMRGQIRQPVTTRETEQWLHTDLCHIEVSGNRVCVRRKRQ